MSRQGKNIYLRKDGRWEARYPKGRENGRIKYGYVFGRTYEEAEAKREEAIKHIHCDTGSTAERQITFRNAAQEWLRMQKPELKPSSIAKYQNINEIYLIPQFGDKAVGSIERNDVMEFSRELLESGGTRSDGLSPKTVNSILSVMRNIFKYIGREKGITMADISDISVKQSQKPMRILSIDEQRKLSEYLCAHPSMCNLGILLCLYTGLRIGEICALKWSDIHLSEKYLFIHHTLQRIQIQSETEKRTKVVMQKPKSDCSIRMIPIPEDLIPLLTVVKSDDNAFFLTGQPKYFIEPRCMENRFKNTIHECGLPDINFHALRHTFATRCVELGFDVKSLSEILGHANVNITMNRYVHPSMGLKKKNMNRLSGLLTTK